MATRTTRYKSHSPTPSPTHAYEQPQPFTTGAVGSMTLETRGSQDNLYGSRNDLTLPPFSKNLVVGNGAPNSPRHSNYTQTYSLSPSRDARNFTRNSRPIQVQEDGAAIRAHHYSYDDINYCEFSQTKPPMNVQDPEPPAHRQLPAVGNSEHTNGSRLPPINHSAYQTNYNTNPDAHRQRQLSINSIISSPGANTSSSTYSPFGAPAHGNGTMKKRKKSFGTEGDGGMEVIDKIDRERDCGKANGDSGDAGVNGSHKVKPNVGLGLGLEDPDVRLAAEALGDLRADLNHSGIASRHQNHLQLSTTSSSSSSATTTTGLNSPLSPSQMSNQYALHVNPEDAPLLDLIQNNPNPVLRAASAAGRFSAAAYSTSKTLSPSFKIAAEQFESVAKGRLGDAVGGLVSTVGKRSGLESLVRRSLANSVVTSPEGGKDDSRRLPPPLALSNGTAKKRKTSSGEDTESNGGISSTSSTLGDILEEEKALQKQPQQDTQNWQRLILSTSGIGAMSEESLKSLKYCLEWLRWANSHLGKCIETLKTVLEEYERNKQSMDSDPDIAQSPQTGGSGMASNSAAVSMRDPEETEERKQMLMGRIERLKCEVLKTLKKVINVVDSYAGGALVGETRNMVKRQLLCLPQRLQIALVTHTPSADGNGSEKSMSGPGAAPGGDPAASAQRVIIVAKEGLNMMHNVSRLVEIALVGAEEWCEKLGRKREPEEKNGEGDVKMVEAGQETTAPKDQIMENGEWKGEEGDVEMED